MNMSFSLVETEQKYSYDYSENVYGKDSIVSYGADNDAPLLYYNCYSNSATLKSIIDGMVAYIIGDDIKMADSAQKWAGKVNKSGMTMRQLVAQISLDYLIYGGFAIQVIYSKLGTVAELYPMNFAKCRTNEYATKIFYSKKNWTKWGTKSEDFEPFDKDNFNLQKPTQVFYYKGDYCKTVYPLPLWHGALVDALTEIECAKYSLNSVSNGFMARYVLSFPNSANLTEAQKKDVEDGIKQKFCGTDTDSNFMLFFSPNETELKVAKIEGDTTPERFIAIKDNARSNIYTSMRTSPLLMGLTSAANTGFSTNEFKDSFKLFQKTVIQAMQDTITEAINKIIGEGAIEILPFTVKFE